MGEVVAPQGILGEVRVYPSTDFPERFLTRRRFFLQGPSPRWAEAEGARFHKGLVLLKFKEVPDRDGAETLRGYLVQVPVDELPPLPEGAYYHHQILGLRAFGPDGRLLGQVVEVLHTGANDVFVVSGEGTAGRQVLIPATRQAVTAIDLAGGRLLIADLPGLLEDGEGDPGAH